MKILLDENLPVKLKYKNRGDHNVYTTHELNWSGKKNGKLLQLLGDNDFDILITADKNINSQQNPDKLKFLIIVLISPDNRFQTLIPHIEKVNEILITGISEKIIEISYDSAQSANTRINFIPIIRCLASFNFVS